MTNSNFADRPDEKDSDLLACWLMAHAAMSESPTEVDGLAKAVFSLLSRIDLQTKEIAALQQEKNQAIRERESIGFAAQCQLMVMQCHYPEHGLLSNAVEKAREQIESAKIRTDQLVTTLREVVRMATCHHSDEQPNHWLHALLVEIPELVNTTLAVFREYAK